MSKEGDKTARVIVQSGLKGHKTEDFNGVTYDLCFFLDLNLLTIEF